MRPRARARALSLLASRSPTSFPSPFSPSSFSSPFFSSYVKYDNCGEYGLGNARFVAFADAANATNRPMFISTEPFLLVPNPSHATFSNSWRTTNDINP